MLSGIKFSFRYKNITERVKLKKFLRKGKTFEVIKTYKKFKLSKFISWVVYKKVIKIFSYVKASKNCDQKEFGSEKVENYVMEEQREWKSTIFLEKMIREQSKMIHRFQNGINHLKSNKWWR